MPPQAQQRRKSSGVLIVTAQELQRQQIGSFLKALGFEVFEAKNGREALLKLSEHPARVQFILTDLLLPCMTGIELARLVRELHPKVKLYYMAAADEGTMEDRTHFKSQINFLQKPISLGILFKILSANAVHDHVVK